MLRFAKQASLWLVQHLADDGCDPAADAGGDEAGVGVADGDGSEWGGALWSPASAKKTQLGRADRAVGSAGA